MWLQTNASVQPVVYALTRCIDWPAHSMQEAIFDRLHSTICARFKSPRRYCVPPLRDPLLQGISSRRLWEQYCTGDSQGRPNRRRQRYAIGCIETRGQLGRFKFEVSMEALEAVNRFDKVGSPKSRVAGTVRARP